MGDEFDKILAGNYEWRNEVDTLIEDHNKRIERGETKVDQYGYEIKFHKAPVDEVLKFAACARRKSEIWAVITGYIARYNNDTEEKITEYENWFLNRFLTWYILKHNLPYSTLPFLEAKRVLLKIALGEFPDDLESSEIREFLMEQPVIKKENEW